MDVSNITKIGTHFKKENIFLATISNNGEDTIEMLKSRTEGIPDKLLRKLTDGRCISFEEYDVFYKDENGYTRFVEEGPETFVGDNSDGKGFIKNVVPIWDYYPESEVVEATVNSCYISIFVTTMEPLYKYNEDYNKK